MAYSYDEMQGDPTDPMDHPADGGHNDSHNPGRAGMQTADATVTPLHPPGTFSRNTDGGDSVNAVAKGLGMKPPANIIKFPRK